MKLRYYILGIIIVLVDQITKFLFIEKYFSIIPNFLSITYTENTRGAFGIGNRYFVLVISMLIIAGFIIFVIKKRDSIKFFLPYVLIISGSIGNLIDRIFRGFVIDFIDVNLFNFPNFNIADICIVLGVFLLISKLGQKRGRVPNSPIGEFRDRSK